MVFARRINVLYLAFDSHHPAQHKRSVVSTLMRRANTIPSSEALRTEETSHVQDSLQVNGYPTNFIENAAQTRSGPQNHHPDPAGLAVVPYVQGISDRVKRTLQQFNMKTAFKPKRTLASVFKKTEGPSIGRKNSRHRLQGWMQRLRFFLHWWEQTVLGFEESGTWSRACLE